MVAPHPLRRERLSGAVRGARGTARRAGLPSEHRRALPRRAAGDLLPQLAAFLSASVEPAAAGGAPAVPVCLDVSAFRAGIAPRGCGRSGADTVYPAGLRAALRLACRAGTRALSRRRGGGALDCGGLSIRAGMCPFRLSGAGLRLQGTPYVARGAKGDSSHAARAGCADTHPPDGG